ncbi:MAG: nuclear transport factor 2 family protein [Alphaproteobacteria bacterium]|nr:nuclear transport factor 2 family protein [Alphaproteobacteria bacterium]
MATAKKKSISSKKAATSKKPAPKSAPSSARKSKPSLSLLKFPRPSLVSQLGGSGERLSPRLQAAIDKSEIAELLASFARGIDRVDENLLRSVLHPDATLDLGPGVFQGTGGDYVHWVLGVLQGVRSSHHMITNIRVELDGDAALVESYFSAHIRIEKPIGREDVFMGGRNLDRFERRPSGSAGVWKIVHRKQVLDWVRTEAVSDIFYHQNPDALWSYRTKTDASYQMAQFPGTQTGGKLPAFLGRHYESKSVKF